MPKEILQALPAGAQNIWDATLGLGGHAQLLLQKASRARFLGSDRDQEALKLAKEKLKDNLPRIELRAGSFLEVASNLPQGKFDFIMADLGVSSFQLDHPARGFSFQQEGPLDMRMDQGSGLSLAQFFDKTSVEELKRWIFTYGEERFAPRVASSLLEAWKKGELRHTLDLAQLVEKAIPKKFHSKKRHPATRVFQALRMGLNQELQQLEGFLELVLGLLSPKGRVVFLAFHSLEDRLVKRAFRKWEVGCICPKNMPHCICGEQPWGKRLFPKALRPELEEVAQNPRSRSARLRGFQKRA